MSASVFVGNLPFQATEADVASWARALLGSGLLATRLITDRDSGKSKGFAFLDVTDADVAMAALDGVEFAGRRVRCAPAAGRRERPGVRAGAGG